MAMNPFPNRGFQRNGMVRGQGQLRRGSPYLDRALEMTQPDNREMDPVGGSLDPAVARQAAAWHAARKRQLKNNMHSALMSGVASRRPQEAPPAQSQPEPKRVGNFGVTSGYDASNWGQGRSLKYLASEIIARYADPQTGRIGKSSIVQAMQDPDWTSNPYLQKATFDGIDKINFGGVLSDLDRGGVPVYEVDVIRNLGDDGFGDALVWQDLVNTGAPAAAPLSMPMGPSNSQGANIARALLDPQAGANVSIDQLLQALIQDQEQAQDYSFLFNQI